MTWAEEFDLREQRLSELGFATYGDYLESPHWRSVRSRAKHRAKRRCETCADSAEPLNTHHVTYRRLGAERSDDLKILCTKCHEDVHREMLGSRVSRSRPDYGQRPTPRATAPRPSPRPSLILALLLAVVIASVGLIIVLEAMRA